ncbi:hypothetical protein SEUCBS140593_001956 [Sporothrix eucalyptigena]|uniref:NACHT-NTPase and P-loop NTPases N-terminal domain-containing protein n=1 Tax=Sporothrix eucalyptigena TaxID=1812306 RepID=A0ABP0B2R2_9PEZI
MDPLTALGLASNIVQFVDFTLKLIGSAAEIASSAKGASEQTLKIESAYEKLETFTTYALIDSIKSVQVDQQKPGASLAVQPPASLSSFQEAERLEDVLARLSLEEQDIETMAREQILIRSLHFKSLEYRHESIPKAHRSTFEWLFPVDIRQNVDSDADIYDNSQKDTNSDEDIEHDTRTRAALEKWAGTGKTLVIAAHYFWNPGKPMQKTLKGLLQTLLYDILRSCPGLAASIFPKQFGAIRPANVAVDRHNPNQVLLLC